MKLTPLPLKHRFMSPNDIVDAENKLVMTCYTHCDNKGKEIEEDTFRSRALSGLVIDAVNSYEALQEENKKMRSALEEIAKKSMPQSYIRAIARAALEGLE